MFNNNNKLDLIIILYIAAQDSSHLSHDFDSYASTIFDVPLEEAFPIFTKIFLNYCPLQAYRAFLYQYTLLWVLLCHLKWEEPYLSALIFVSKFMLRVEKVFIDWLSQTYHQPLSFLSTGLGSFMVELHGDVEFMQPTLTMLGISYSDDGDGPFEPYNLMIYET